MSIILAVLGAIALILLLLAIFVPKYDYSIPIWRGYTLEISKYVETYTVTKMWDVSETKEKVCFSIEIFANDPN